MFDLDEWRMLLADATFAATHGNAGVGQALLAQAEGIYADNPGAFVGYEDELKNARLYVTGTVDRIAVAEANAQPESLGVMGTILTNRTIGDGISYAGGFAYNLGLIDENDLQSGQDKLGAERAPKVPVLGGIIRWVREHPMLAAGLALGALAAPTVLPLAMRATRSNPRRRKTAKTAK